MSEGKKEFTVLLAQPNYFLQIILQTSMNRLGKKGGDESNYEQLGIYNSIFVYSQLLVFIDSVFLLKYFWILLETPCEEFPCWSNRTVIVCAPDCSSYCAPHIPYLDVPHLSINASYLFWSPVLYWIWHLIFKKFNRKYGKPNENQQYKYIKRCETGRHYLAKTVLTDTWRCIWKT